MKILFIHQNMPGQFKYLAPELAKNPNNTIAFLTKREDVTIPNVLKLQYKEPKPSSVQTHQYLHRLENAVRYGQQVARGLIELQRKDFVPDLIIAHPGWGEALYCKDVFPAVPLINYCEFFYRGRGLDVDFDPEMPADIDSICRTRTRSSGLLLSLEACDIGVSPTEWQKSTHPEPYLDRIRVIFDGIDTDRLAPNSEASIALGDGRRLTREDKVLTFVARNLEPYRGYHILARAIPEIQRLQPEAHLVIVGGDEVSYGAPPQNERFETWREQMDAEVEYDASRVHFLGRVPYARYMAILQSSRAHIYLTYPFVLSWSCFEAMACGVPIIGSRTAPVEEVVTHEEQGLLFDFFDPEELARQADILLKDPGLAAELGANARSRIVERYSLPDALEKWKALVESCG
ncbi:glycosyltransferase family 4 protein [Parasphingopyxis marina]|uniref:Glycosyltransferase n=1 Tax=Parasphingopyxis marina TaxID=2761622 RepID=A0A842HSM5_9SPHN|nr:glycosyltransferase family 4 protein [Parasphingopyxis marina]MBC2776022.1 glycosyltransferase [Parasphingopyxis marina]